MQQTLARAVSSQQIHQSDAAPFGAGVSIAPGVDHPSQMPGNCRCALRGILSLLLTALVWLCCTFIVPAPALAQSVTTYDPARDFSQNNNPAFPWSYGSYNSSGNFAPLTNAYNYATGVDSWRGAVSSNFGPFPAVGANRSGSDLAGFYGSMTWKNGYVWFSPASDQSRAVLRFMVPTSGFYTVSGQFEGMLPGRNADVRITAATNTSVVALLADTPLVGMATIPFNLPRYFNAGDVVDFSVGVGADGVWTDDSTALQLTISTGAVFNAVSDFKSPASNPNPATYWTYGMHTTLASAFVPYAYSTTTLLDIPNFQAWGANPNDFLPIVAKNATGSTFNYMTVTMPVDRLNVHPGAQGEYSTVRFTAPAAGTYHIVGVFESLDTLVGATTDVYVLVNGENLTGSLVIAGLNSQQPFDVTRSLAAGDVVEFSVGKGSNNYYYDSTGLAATITPLTAPSNYGKEFWLAFPKIDPAPGWPVQIQLKVTAGDQAANFTVAYAGTNYSQSFSLAARQTTTLTFDPPYPNAFNLTTSDGLEINKSFHVTSNTPISIVAVSYGTYVTDSYLALPVEALGTDYTALAYIPLVPSATHTEHNVSHLVIVATQDNTTVSLTPPQSFKVGNPGRHALVPYTITLEHAGDAYELNSTPDRDRRNDATGMGISADKPIAVLGGGYASVPDLETGYFNDIMEMLPPSTLWGTRFLTIPYAVRGGGDLFRVVAARFNTQVFLNGSLQATLKRGEFWETVLVTPSEITTSKPALVAQYSQGYEVDNDEPDEELGPMGVGDPSMTLVPATSQYPSVLAGQTVAVPNSVPQASAFSHQFLNVIVPSSATGLIQLNGLPIGAGQFFPLGGTGFSYALLNISGHAAPWTYRLSTPSNVPIAGIGYGLVAYDAYSLPLGFTFSEVTPFAPVPNAPTNLTATAQLSLKVQLNWTDNSTDEEGFVIERQGASMGEWSYAGTVGPNVTTYTDSQLAPTTTYTYRVCAFRDLASESSNEASATTFPSPSAAPTLYAQTVSQTQIDLTWSAGFSAQGIKIERKRVSPNPETTWTQIADVSATSSTYPSTGLTSDTTYAYRARTYNQWGDSEYSNTATARTLAYPPAAPSGLVATAVGPHEIDLVWADNSNNENGFRIQRSLTGSANSWISLATTGPNVTTFKDETCEGGTTYFYRVCAYDSGGDSAWSNVASATTDTIPAPDVPTNLIATAISSSQITLVWTDSSDDETAFEIARKQGDAASSAIWQQVGTVSANATTYTDAGLSANTTYTYRVRATNSGGSSAWSNLATATTMLLQPPDAPSNLVATSTSTSSITLSWLDNSSDETGFQIERKLGPDSSGNSWTAVAITAMNATEFTNTGLTANTEYTYRARAVNAAGNSAWSNSASATTLSSGDSVPVMPDDIVLVATACGSDRIVLYWTTKNQYSNFHIYRSSDGINFTKITASPVNSVESGPTLMTTYRYVATGLSVNTDYFFYVVGLNNTGAQVCKSEIDVAAPVFDATPWDTGSPQQIITSLRSKIDAILPPDYDDDGTPIPSEVGLLKVVGPNGIVYQGDSQSVPATSLAASGIYNKKNSTIEFPDGTSLPLTKESREQGSGIGLVLENSTSSISLLTEFDKDYPVLESSSPCNLTSVGSQTIDYPYSRTLPPTGIFRMVESLPGSQGIIATVGLPDAVGSQNVYLARYDNTSVGMDVAYIYVGGHVEFPLGTPPFPDSNEVPDYAMDIGLCLNRSVINNASQWQPFITPSDARRSMLFDNGFIHNGDVKALMTGDIRLKFFTPMIPGVEDKNIIAHYSVARTDLGYTGKIQVDRFSRDSQGNVQREKIYEDAPGVTIVYVGVRGWRNRPYIQGQPVGNNNFVLKRVNSIAQSLNLPANDPDRNSPRYPGDRPNRATANAPSYATLKGYWANNSRVLGASWGGPDGQSLLIKDGTGGGLPWDTAKTSRQGKYPGGPQITYTVQNPYFWENNINLRCTY